MLPSASALASRREERVQKAFSVDHHGPGDARLSQSAAGIYGESGDYVLRKVPLGLAQVPLGKNQVPLGGRNGASGSCKARLEKRVGAARRPSPGPTRTSHWEARHYRARATSSGVPVGYLPSFLLSSLLRKTTERAGTHHTAAVKNRHRERYPRAKGLKGSGRGQRGSQSLRLIMCALHPPVFLKLLP